MAPRRVWCPKLPRSTPLPPIRPHASTCLERFGLRDTHRMQDWMLRLRRMAAREMPWVHPLDASLQTIPMGVFRMVPVALDMRPNRAIVGFDITSACGYAVAHGTIPDPKRLRRANASNHHLGQPGWAGYYRIDVGRPRSSMPPPWYFVPTPAADAPHRGVMCRRTSHNEPYTTWIHHSEWSGWNAIWECSVLEGIEGPAVPHPLASVAREVWQYREQGDPDAKLLLASMHTCMGPTHANAQGPFADAIWSVHRMPMGWVRGEWLRRYHQIQTSYPDAQLCYANVDSQHWSLPLDAWTTNPIRNTPTTLGAWRTIIEGTKGVWLALGKYWIAQDNRVLCYQNAGSAHPWQTKTRHHVPLSPTCDYSSSYATYIWHGMASHTRLARKETDCIVYIPPTIQSVQDGLDLNTLALQSLRADRPWKKKIWYQFRGNIHEEEQMAPHPPGRLSGMAQDNGLGHDQHTGEPPVGHRS